MFINLDILFTLINFGIVIALAYYLYTKYGRNLLFEHMRSRQEAKRLLQLEEQALKEEQERLKNLIQEEQRQSIFLLEKVARWRKVQDQEQINNQEEQLAIMRALEKKAHEQAQLYAQHQLTLRILPQVITKAHRVLNKKFEEPHKQDAYLDDIITYMKKSVR